MSTPHFDSATQAERALLGTVLYANHLWPQTADLSVEDFLLDSHRRIYGCLAAMFEDQRPVDLITLTEELGKRNQLDGCGGPAYLASLDDHALPENFEAYVRGVREASRERRYSRLEEQLGKSIGTDERLNILQQMQELISGSSGGQNWKSLFHTYEEITNALRPASR